MTPPRTHVNHQDFHYRGKTYTLGHLNGFDVTYSWPDKNTGQVTTFEVRIVFDDHCFTRGIPLDEAHDPAEVVSRTRKEIRLFDPERYELSRALPDIVKSLIQRECYFGDQNNFFTIEIGDGRKYNVYFQVFKASSRPRLTLSVRSAYLRTQVDKLAKVSFGLILKSARDSKELRRPR